MHKIVKNLGILSITVALFITFSSSAKAAVPPAVSGFLVKKLVAPSYQLTNNFSNFSTSQSQVGNLPILGASPVSGTLTGSTATWNMGKQKPGTTGGAAVVSGTGPVSGCVQATAILYAGESAVASDTSSACVSDFVLTANPSSSNVYRGASTQSTITVRSYNFTGTVNLSLIGPTKTQSGIADYQLKDGSNVVTSLSLTPGYTKNLTLSVQTGTSAVYQSYSIGVRATDTSNPSHSKQTNFSVNIIRQPQNASCGTITVVPSKVAPEGKTKITVNMVNNGQETWSAANGFALNFSSNGNSLTPSPLNHTISGSVPSDSTLTLDFEKGVPGVLGSYPFTVQMVKGGNPFGEACTRTVLVTPDGGSSGQQLRITGDVYSKDNTGKLICDGQNSIAVSGGDPSKASNCQYNIKQYSPVLEWEQDESVPWRNKEMNRNIENLKNVAKDFSEIATDGPNKLSGNATMISYLPEGAVYYSTSDITLSNISQWKGANTTIISEGTITLEGNFRDSDTNPDEVTVGLIAKNGITVSSSVGSAKHVAFFSPGTVKIDGPGNFTMDGMIASHTLDIQRTGTTQINYDPLFLKTPPPGFTQTLLPSWE